MSKKAKLLDLLGSSTNQTQIATEIFKASKRRIKNQILIIKDKIASKKEQIVELNRMSVVTDVNAGIQAMDESEVTARLKKIIAIKEEIALEEVTLRIAKETYNEYFGTSSSEE